MQEDTSQKAVAVAANQQNIFFMKYLLKCTCTTPCCEICTLNKYEQLNMVGLFGSCTPNFELNLCKSIKETSTIAQVNVVSK